MTACASQSQGQWRLGLIMGLLMTWMLQACIYTQAVSTTNIPANRKNKVSVSTKRFIVLGLVFDNDEVLDLPNKLHEKCPEGAVRGITTHNFHTYYFLDLFWQREVVATGYCVKASYTAHSGELEDVVTKSDHQDALSEHEAPDEVKL